MGEEKWRRTNITWFEIQLQAAFLDFGGQRLVREDSDRAIN